MTHFDYITKHMLPGWVESWTYNFKVWSDLMTGNYKPYVEPWSESPERDCYEWFWASINLDDIYSKEFIESFYQMMGDIDTGKVRTYPAEDVLKRLKELVEEDNNEQL